MPHLHLSLQAGDDLILKRMKRRHLRDDAIAFCAEVRDARPDVVFGADFIAGFPTETEAMFEKTLQLVGECGLTWLHVFPFSARAGTPAARMPPTPGPAIRERARRLRALGAERAEAHLAAMAGRRVSLLMETPTLGRTEGFARTELAGLRRPGEIVRRGSPGGAKGFYAPRRPDPEARDEIAPLACQQRMRVSEVTRRLNWRASRPAGPRRSRRPRATTKRQHQRCGDDERDDHEPSGRTEGGEDERPEAGGDQRRGEEQDHQEDLGGHDVCPRRR